MLKLRGITCGLFGKSDRHFIASLRTDDSYEDSDTTVRIKGKFLIFFFFLRV